MAMCFKSHKELNQIQNCSNKSPKATLGSELFKFARWCTWILLFSLARKSENVYNLSDILIRDHDVRTYFTGPHGRGKILHFAGSGHRSCGEATCYPEILRISYNFV